MKSAVYPGSFDPVTLGHLDIIRRVSAVFDQLTVLVAHSNSKQQMFSPEERKQLILESLPDVSNVKVDAYSGLTVDYLKQNKCDVIIRGLRAISDFEYELVMANMNKKLAPEIETMIVFANPEYHYVSSKGIKEVAVHDGPIEKFVSPAVVKALKEKLNK